MTKSMMTALAGVAAALFVSAPASAADLDDQLNLCAAAAQAEGLTAADVEYRVKFISIKGGSAKTLEVELIPSDGGAAIPATCKLRRGKVTEVALTA